MHACSSGRVCATKMSDVHPEVLSARACRAGSRVRKRLAGVERELAQADDLVQHLTARRAALETAAEPEPAAQRQKTQASTDDSPTRPSLARGPSVTPTDGAVAPCSLLIGTLQQAERERAASEQGAVQQMALQRLTPGCAQRPQRRAAGRCRA